jgi:hypothetical protein
MANVNKPFGLRPIGNLSATGAQKQFSYQIASGQAGAIFQGDLVTIVNGSLVKFNNTDHTAAVGVFNGCNFVDPTSGKPTFKNFYPGAITVTSGIISAEVLDDPNQLFLIQAEGTPTQAAIGKNADITAATAGSTVTGVSAMTVGTSFVNNADRNLKVVGLFEAPENSLAEFAVLVVKINEHMYGSAGVVGLGA